MRVHFITFGGPTTNYHNRVNIICKEAYDSNFFNNIEGYTDLNINDEFKKQHGNFINENKKGYGYWIWKSYIISNYLINKCDIDDILIYADAGCTINKKGYKRFYDYINMLQECNNGIIAFQMDHLKESLYSKKTLLNYMKTSLDDMNSGQCHATIIMIRKCKCSLNIVNEWYNLCSHYQLIDDTNNNDIQHRHDQSIYSLLIKQHCCYTIPDETYFNKYESIKFLYPFWATRIRQ